MHIHTHRTTPITMASKIIHDPLYGDIAVSYTAIQIIDTPVYSRLADIKQTSMAYRVFPAARHSRLNHQVGVYGLTRRTLDSLQNRKRLRVIDSGGRAAYTPHQMLAHMSQGNVPEITEDEAEWICLGGLLHDLGHGPASHTFDNLIDEFIRDGKLAADCSWRTHEERSQYMFREMVATTPGGFGLTDEAVDYICNVINPPVSHHHDFRFQFINNEVNGVDLDKIDYLERDRYVFGLTNCVDVDRLIGNSSIAVDARASNVVRKKSHLRVDEMGEGTYWTFGERTRDDIFTLFMTRFKLYRDIYNHAKIVKFELAYLNVLRANELSILDTFRNRDVIGFAEMTDESMLWRAPAVARREFGARDTFVMLRGEEDLTAFTQVVCFEETVGFFGKGGFNPFEHVRFHDRKSGEVVVLRPDEISKFLGFDHTSEKIRYAYGYRGVVM